MTHLTTIFDKINAQHKSAYVIAELGSNYKTDKDLKLAVHHAKSVGADAIKFQFFDRSELFGPKIKFITNNWLPECSRIAKDIGIDLICSTFSPEGMLRVNEYVGAHKIASAEMSHIRLLETAKLLGKTLILSTGGHGLDDVRRVLSFLNGYPTIVLHCNIVYPTRYVDFQKFNALKRLHYGPVGYSDHTTNIDVVPMAMVTQGAKCYEKHWNPFGYQDTPDAPVSLSNEEFKTMVSCIRGTPHQYTEENYARTNIVRRLLALRDIKAGEIFSEGNNIGIYRPQHHDTNGQSPMDIGTFLGRKAKRDIAYGAGISFNDVT